MHPAILKPNHVQGSWADHEFWGGGGKGTWGMERSPGSYLPIKSPPSHLLLCCCLMTVHRARPSKGGLRGCPKNNKMHVGLGVCTFGGKPGRRRRRKIKLVKAFLHLVPLSLLGGCGVPRHKEGQSTVARSWCWTLLKVFKFLLGGCRVAMAIHGVFMRFH